MIVICRKLGKNQGNSLFSQKCRHLKISKRNRSHGRNMKFGQVIALRDTKKLRIREPLFYFSFFGLMHQFLGQKWPFLMFFVYIYVSILLSATWQGAGRSRFSIVYLNQLFNFGQNEKGSNKSQIRHVYSLYITRRIYFQILNKNKMVIGSGFFEG